jgi:hypothetical protein
MQQPVPPTLPEPPAPPAPPVIPPAPPIPFIPPPPVLETPAIPTVPTPPPVPTITSVSVLLQYIASFREAETGMNVTDTPGTSSLSQERADWLATTFHGKGRG